MRCLVVPLSFAALIVAFPAELPAQAPPAGFEVVDREIEIGVLPGRLRYDRESFTVAPGSKVRLVLRNTDSMQHNLLICRPGPDVIRRVGVAAAELGARASERHFVPDLPEVLFHTRAILPGQSDTLWFTAPAEPGDYGYVCTLPGHMFTMVGVMHVSAAAEPAGLAELRYRLYEGRWRKLPDFEGLEPFATGELESGRIELGRLSRRRDYAAQFEGVLRVARAGRHTFFLNSDDGSRLVVDGSAVAIYDGTHPAADEQVAEVMLDVGEHRLRVDYFQAGGGQVLQLACAGPDGVRRSLTAESPREPDGIPIPVHEHPVVMRVHVEGAGPRSIAVGLPGGVNYCFDADRCSVAFGWVGAFLDVGPDRLGRGGRPCVTLGPRFSLGDMGFPLRHGDGTWQPVRMRGYRTVPTPRFDLDWGGLDVAWTIAPAPSGVGLQYAFSIPAAPGALRFSLDPRGLTLSASAGQWRDGVLTIPPGAARAFTVTIVSGEAR